LPRRSWTLAAARSPLIAAALAAGWFAFILIGDSWWQLGVAALLAIVLGQIGFSAMTPGTVRFLPPIGPITFSASCFLEAIILPVSSISALIGQARQRRTSPKGSGRHWSWEAGLLTVHVNAYPRKS
jgi:hypothetical protein